MNFFYNILIHVVWFILKIVALFNKKISLFVNGRKETFSKLTSIKKTDKVIWVHAASLGEFEQGRPIIEKIKEQYRDYKIVVTFFSPSGYEIRKNYNLADVVCYLPFDSKKNCAKFITQIHPDIAIIIKYEFWPNLLQELRNNHITTILVSGIFRKKQSFFKPYGKWMRKKLDAFNHFFVQNNSSKELLNSIGYNNVTVSGDTRFDRVFEILQQDNSLDFIKNFKNNCYTVVAGSTWKEDEVLLVNYINNKSSKKEKFIIAPHNINTKNIATLRNSIDKKTILYSEKDNVNITDYNVFIIDTIGLLTKIYSYADVAYVGGGLATGLHNVLEPAVFGIPLIFGGNKYQKFKEATDLVHLNGAKTIHNEQELFKLLLNLFVDKNKRDKMGVINKNYVIDNKGATTVILKHINTNL